MPLGVEDACVIRRVGGLEDERLDDCEEAMVIRRVGGLEERASCCRPYACVIRRVGGLEVCEGRAAG